MSALTVRDLKRMLEGVDEDEVVMIKAHGNGGVGPMSAVAVHYANSGFDWDKGRFILSPKREDSLRLETEEDKLAHLFYSRCVDSWAAHQPPLGDGTLKNFSRSLKGHFQELIAPKLQAQRDAFYSRMKKDKSLPIPSREDVENEKRTKNERS